MSILYIVAFSRYARHVARNIISPCYTVFVTIIVVTVVLDNVIIVLSSLSSVFVVMKSSLIIHRHSHVIDVVVNVLVVVMFS